MSSTPEKLIRDHWLATPALTGFVAADRVFTEEPEDETVDIQDGPYVVIDSIDYTAKDARGNTGTGIKRGDLIINVHHKSWSAGKAILKAMENSYDKKSFEGPENEDCITDCRFEHSSERQTTPGWHFSQVYEVKVQ